EGLDVWRGGRVQRAAIPGLARHRINALVEDREGTLWIGTDRDGLQAVKDGRPQPVPAAERLAGSTVHSVLAARDGSVWFGTLGGLGRLRDGRLTWLTRDDGLPSTS